MPDGVFPGKKGEIEDMSEDDGDSPGTQRLDKWLWFARLAKTRSLAQRLVMEGRVRINRERTVKPAQAVRPGDMISVDVGERLRLLEVLAPGARRGPASEAALLFRDLAPLPPRGEASAPTGPAAPVRDPGAGRPTKRERRQTDRLRER
jgi:ribosome-associated heat shock protein Hsp15